MALRLARVAALAVIAASIAFPAAASAADTTGGVTPLVAPHRGYIKYVGDQPGGAGIYIVMHASGTSYDFALMHLQPGSLRVHEGQGVKAGTRLGSVGHTGDA